MKKIWLTIAMVFALSFTGTTVLAAENSSEFNPNDEAYFTPEFKAVATKLSSFCVETSLYDCLYGPLVRDVKPEIVKQLKEGKSTQQILDYFVNIYGEEILVQPKAQGFNLTAYVLPFVVLGGAGIGIFFVVRTWVRSNNSKDDVEQEELSSDETESEIIKQMIDDERKKYL